MLYGSALTAIDTLPLETTAADLLGQLAPLCMSTHKARAAEIILHLAKKSQRFTFHEELVHRRASFLHKLSHLIPAIAHIGGDKALEQVFYALVDVCHWWP